MVINCQNCPCLDNEYLWLWVHGGWWNIYQNLWVHDCRWSWGVCVLFFFLLWQQFCYKKEGYLLNESSYWKKKTCFFCMFCSTISKTPSHMTVWSFRFSSGSGSVCTHRISVVVYDYFPSSNNRNPRGHTQTLPLENLKLQIYSATSLAKLKCTE